MPAVNSKPAETPVATEAPVRTEAPVCTETPETPVPACWSFLYPTVPYPTLTQTAELQAELRKVRGNGVLGLLPDRRDDPELFKFSCRLRIPTMQVLLVDAGYTADFRSLGQPAWPVTDKETFHERLRTLQGNRAFCAALDGAE
jgi:hypothetical protein|eukprot:COSAG06_NODE_650_length_13391_cov_5.990445_7_plen_144_part_00